MTEFGGAFTLCCLYTLFAHSRERKWAAEYGAMEHLVRIGVGLEELDVSKEKIRVALAAAEGAGTQGMGEICEEH